MIWLLSQKKLKYPINVVNNIKAGKIQISHNLISCTASYIDPN